MPPTTSHKRTLPFGGLQRRVRARREEPEPEPEDYSADSQEEGSEGDDMDDGSDIEDQNSDEQSDSAFGSEEEEAEDEESEVEGGEEEEEEDDDDDDDDDPSSAAAQLSFGALARAQASMPSIRQKKGRKARNEAQTQTQSEDEDQPRNRKQDDHRASSSFAKPDTKPSKPPKPPQRSSKHAPMEMSSKREVTRRREVISVNKVASRDPRFSSATSTSTGGSNTKTTTTTTTAAIEEARARKAYAFLDEYRDSEMATLRASLKKTKSHREREAIARTLKSMQSRKEAQARRDAEREVIARHRQKEKELVAQGKRPFYLKKSEQKKQVLVDRFAGMKKRQVDRAIERRRKKLTSKERRDMPVARRGAE